MESQKCQLCARNSHLAIDCPFQHTPCIKTNCNGTMKLLTSKSLENPQRRYLKCQTLGCKGFQWVDEAILRDHGQASSSSTVTVFSSSSVTGCFICGEPNHWMKDCQWKPIPCTTEGCSGIRRWLTSKNANNPGKKYLKCFSCKSFQWSSHENEKPSTVKTKVLIEAGLDEDELKEFCEKFPSKIVFK